MTAEQALAAAEIIREFAKGKSEWGLYPLAEALEEYATRKGLCPSCGEPWSETETIRSEGIGAARAESRRR